MSPSRRIPLYITGERALVFDVADIAIIRTEHRVCGLLIGTLPHLAQQNVFLGPPLVLTPEEVVLLMTNEAAVLVDDPRAHAVAPTPAQIATWQAARDAEVEAQHTMAAQRVRAAASAAEARLTPEALAKRAARQSRAPTPALVPMLDTTPETPPLPDSEPAHFVEVPSSSTQGLPWHDPVGAKAVYPTIAAARKAGVWSYPSTAYERARCAVFRALWDQEYWMGGGVRFGGDYLVYPGDPLRYHSHFVATVHDPHAALRPMEIVAHGRLGTGTRKSHLFCAWDERTNEVDFYSIEWSGFG
ncbi:tRNA-intron endonuclease catalytic domain-like protein [Exidia glandulosa HHB12029]|uniref:tRNA-splicing endonuclease subunit Sen34 n=1 Tax=Exidia glandulosa HHB12029 TaxID=1314781 RepID=A0A166B984_EXIGL|nr:tRNA-intron endonuclease catalytic domain-like protein [Exidia glandulosa HHB12029]